LLVCALALTYYFLLIVLTLFFAIKFVLECRKGLVRSPEPKNKIQFL